MARRSKPKGEYAISVALAGAVLLTVLLIQRRWLSGNLQDVATSAEEFILIQTGLHGELPDIKGYERLKTYHLGRYHGGLYRASPAPLVFAPGRFIIYDRHNQPVFKLETVEGSKDSWTTLYNFSGRQGLPIPGSRARPIYTRSLSGNGDPDIVIGQYSGGDHCCTTATVVELRRESVKMLGRIGQLDGLPFEGMEIRKIGNDPIWEIVARRPYQTLCGSHYDAADVLSVYTTTDGQYTDQTAHYADFLEGVLRQNLAKWSREKARSMQLLQTLAVDYAALGKQEEGKRFFATNTAQFLADLKNKGLDANACQEDLENLVDRLPSVTP